MWIIYSENGDQVAERRSYQSAKHVVKALSEKYGNAHYAIHTKSGNRID